MKNKKILITGGCGFLGSNLAKRLVELGAKVSLFVRSEENKENIKNIESEIQIIKGNLLDKKDVEKAVEGVDYLYHFAWQTDLKKSMQSPREDLESDLIGLINILETCREKNPDIKIIFPSTVTVIGEASKIPSNEEEKEKPISVYDIHKLLAEKYLQMYYKNYNIKSCVLRLSNVFGEGQKIDNPNRGVLNFMIGRALRSEELTVYGEGDFIRDYNYVQNYVDAFILAAESEKTNGKVFVLGSGEGKTFQEVVGKIKEIVERDVGKEVKITHVAFPEDTHEINKRNYIADSTKFKETTGWKPNISFEDGLKRTIEFYS
jgi:nucleoside-diphosphate-sugar epimerase